LSAKNAQKEWELIANGRTKRTNETNETKTAPQAKKIHFFLSIPEILEKI
jgi:hypothetical protein